MSATCQTTAVNYDNPPWKRPETNIPGGFHRANQLFKRPWASALASLLVILCMAVPGQSQIVNQYTHTHVTVTGNSIAHFQAPFATREFPAILNQNVWIWGIDSAPCSTVLTLILQLVPANTDIAVLIDSTNDVKLGISVSQHMACIEQTITALLERNASLKVVVANTPPWTQYNPCTGTDRDDSIVDEIRAYNATYADPISGLQALWPNNVRVADVFTPSAYPDGWAIPDDMSGPCGVHPGQEFQWSTSWSHFAAPYEALVLQAVRQQW
jgi:hypothetical protein